MQLHLVDINAELVDAWREAFADQDAVAVHHNDILAVARGSLVSPANSYGFMDGGIDEAYRDHFGLTLEQRVQEAVGRRVEGYLPVGASLAVPTGRSDVPWLIVAPTMRMPEPVPASHAYRALRAVLRLVDADPDRHREVYCPGLATGTGRVPAGEAAKEMAEAYRDWAEARQGGRSGVSCDS
jgi:O-acetyl-ADP-ribose deacetylase (regulator of RNase III)